MKYFFFVMLALIVAANAYVIHRIWLLIPPQPGVFRWIALIAAIAAASFLFLSLLGQNFFPQSTLTFMYRVGGAWIFIMLYLLIAFLLLDLLRGLGVPLRPYLFASWTGFAVLATAVTVVLGAGYANYLHKRRVAETLTVPSGVRLDRPVKIVAISDLHLGYGIGRKEFSRWVDRINAEDADVVLIAGDAIDNSVRPLEDQQMEDEFRRLRSTYGVYAALGNHEYISGIDRSMAFLERAGIAVLRDSTALIDSLFYVVGRDDRSNPRRKSLHELTSALDRTRPVVVLDHQPYGLSQAADEGVTLQVSGHTHRGQVWPISWITDAMFEKSHGWLRTPDSNVYVSTGIGIWGGKFRIGTRSEYLVVTLVPSAD